MTTLIFQLANIGKSVCDPNRSMTGKQIPGATPRLRQIAIAKVTLALLLVPLSSMADVVELKSGEKIQGSRTILTEREVTIELGNRVIRFPRGDVRTIILGNAPLADSPGTPVYGSKGKEAIASLKALQSVTNAGVTYTEYSRRMLDTKVVVDQFVSQLGSQDSELATALRDATGYYALVSLIWSRDRGRGHATFVMFAEDPGDLIGRCQTFQVYLGGILKSRNPNDFKESGGWTIPTADRSIRVLWSCALERSTQAEALLNDMK